MTVVKAELQIEEALSVVYDQRRHNSIHYQHWYSTSTCLIAINVALIDL